MNDDNNNGTDNDDDNNDNDTKNYDDNDTHDSDTDMIMIKIPSIIYITTIMMIIRIIMVIIWYFTRKRLHQNTRSLFLIYLALPGSTASHEARFISRTSLSITRDRIPRMSSFVSGIIKPPVLQ